MGYGYRLGSNPQTGNSYDASLEISEQKCILLLREQEEELNKKARNSSDEVCKLKKIVCILKLQ